MKLKYLGNIGKQSFHSFRNLSPLPYGQHSDSQLEMKKKTIHDIQ